MGKGRHRAVSFRRDNPPCSQLLPSQMCSLTTFAWASLNLSMVSPYLTWWGTYQWGRMLEGWSSTAARLAGWRRVTRQVWFCTWWTGCTTCLFRTLPVALTGAAQLRADGIYSCCYIINVHKHPSWATWRSKAWPGTLVDQCLLSGTSSPSPHPDAFLHAYSNVYCLTLVRSGGGGGIGRHRT